MAACATWGRRSFTVASGPARGSGGFRSSPSPPVFTEGLHPSSDPWGSSGPPGQLGYSPMLGNSPHIGQPGSFTAINPQDRMVSCALITSSSPCFICLLLSLPTAHRRPPLVHLLLFSLSDRPLECMS